MKSDSPLARLQKEVVKTARRTARYGFHQSQLPTKPSTTAGGRRNATAVTSPRYPPVNNSMGYNTVR